MAQYFEKPHIDDLGGPPRNWSAHWSGLMSQLTVKEDSQGELYIEFFFDGATSRRLYTIDTINGVDITSLADVDVYTETMQTDSSSTNAGGRDMRVAIRADRGSTGSETGYTNGLRPVNEEVRLFRYLNGGFNQFGSAPYNRDDFINVKVAQRVNTTGSTHSAKFWAAADVEPVAQAISAQNSDITQPGGVGIFTFNGGTWRLYAWGVGTDGDPAPTEPLTTGEGAEVTPTASLAAATSHAPAVTAGALSTPSMAASESAAYAPSVAAGATVTATASASVSAASGPSVSTAATVSPGASVSASISPAPAVGAAAVVSPASSLSVSTAGAPVVAAGATVKPVTAVSQAVNAAPAVASGVVVMPPVSACTTSIPAPSVFTGELERFVKSVTLSGVYNRGMVIQGQYNRRVTLQ